MIYSWLAVHVLRYYFVCHFIFTHTNFGLEGLFRFFFTFSQQECLKMISEKCIMLKRDGTKDYFK